MERWPAGPGHLIGPRGLVALADRQHCVVVVPLFPGGISNPNDLDSYKFITDGETRFDLILLSVLSEVAERWGAAAEKVSLRPFLAAGVLAGDEGGREQEQDGAGPHGNHPAARPGRRLTERLRK